MLKLFIAFGALLACQPLTASQTLGSLEFRPCQIGSGRLGLSKAECATLKRPENPQAPAGRSIDIRITLIAASSRNAEPDPVVFLAGGPGQGASDSYAQVAPGFAEILKHRNVLLYDQRGTGLSHALRCELPDPLAPESTDDVPEDVARMAKDCLAKLDADPRFYTTSVALTDLEALRIAVGAETLNLVGFSYGTRLAQHYARQYPERTRSMILDGVVPNELVLGSEHAKNLDAALAHQFARCVADPQCHKRFGDPAATLSELRVDYQTVRPFSIPDPLTGKPSEVELGPSVLQGVARFYAYSSETAALLPLLLDEAKQGRPTAMLAQLSMAGAELSEMISHGMQLSVLCSEDAEFLREQPDDAQRLLGNELYQLTQKQCAVWPKGERPADFFTPLTSAVPTLIISGEFDPVTPARYGGQVAKTLSRSNHVVVPGQGHVNLARGCVPRLAAELIAKLQPEKLEFKCIKAIHAAPFFLDYTGPSA